MTKRPLIETLILFVWKGKTTQSQVVYMPLPIGARLPEPSADTRRPKPTTMERE